MTPTVVKSVAPVATQGVFVESTRPKPTPTPTPTPTPEPVVETPTPTPTPEAPATTQAPQQAVVVTKPVESSTPVQAAPTVEQTTAAATVAASPASGDYKSVVLYHHNVHRTNHSAPALTYDDTLAGYAAQLAKTCVFKHDTSIGGGGYGQNLAQSGSSGDEKSRSAAAIPGGAISDQWYNGELPLFDPSMYGESDPDMSNFEGWGHFSQVVWKGTTAVGCASQFCDTGSPMFSSPFSGWYTVCNYGNPGRFPFPLPFSPTTKNPFTNPPSRKRRRSIRIQRPQAPRPSVGLRQLNSLLAFLFFFFSLETRHAKQESHRISTQTFTPPFFAFRFSSTLRERAVHL